MIPARVREYEGARLVFEAVALSVGAVGHDLGTRLRSIVCAWKQRARRVWRLTEH